MEVVLHSCLKKARVEKVPSSYNSVEKGASASSLLLVQEVRAPAMQPGEGALNTVGLFRRAPAFPWAPAPRSTHADAVHVGCLHAARITLPPAGPPATSSTPAPALSASRPKVSTSQAAKTCARRALAAADPLWAKPCALESTWRSARLQKKRIVARQRNA